MQTVSDRTDDDYDTFGQNILHMNYDHYLDTNKKAGICNIAIHPQLIYPPTVSDYISIKNCHQTLFMRIF